MPNDITGINSGRSQQSNDRQVGNVRREDSNTTQGGSSSSNQGDTVSITDMAARLNSLEKKLASEPDVDQAHVNRVRDAISRGEYRVDPDRVADKMMDFESDF
ncbi:MAG: flagellar biosynthesis anti-sigma factor FlgM [Thioalkalispiraceae bacterium]|jgi:negative regulator of flagellin synthesis FlgM